MTKDTNPGAQEPEQSDPLGATAMFLRVFDQKPPENPTQSKVEPLFASSAPATSPARANGPETAPAADPVAGATGEFTRFFRDQAGKESDAAPAPANPAGSLRPGAGPVPPPTQAPGEFTRLFVKGAPEPAKASPPPAESFRQPAASVPGAGGKGFSAPGMSDASSGESSFTQLFKSAPQPPTPFAPTSDAAPGLERRPSARLDFEPTPRVQAAPQSADQSVTNLIASLSSVPRPAGPQEQEVVPYRVEAQPPSFAPEPRPASPATADAGGVTQFIRRLADEPLAPLHDAPAPAPVAAVPEVKGGPGEFTRMISKAEMDAAIGAAPAPQPPPQSTPAPVVQPIAVAVPHVTIPVPPKVPTMPAAAPPVAAAPALSKVPVPAIPAIPAPKGKLESMVPYLMIVNTFLLLVIVLVLVFLIKAH